MVCSAMKLTFASMLVAILVGASNATTYTVGDKTGWTIPPSASFYTNWVAKQTFKVGDVLVFNFPTGAHTVADVSKTAYDSCNTNNVLSAVKSTAPANYTLSSGGTHYFICTITGHCSAGQKISIPVSNTVSSSPPATAPAPAPASSKKTPSPAPTTSPASSPSGTTTSPVPSPAKSTGGAPTQAPSPATGGSPTQPPSPASGTTTPPPSPIGPSPTASSPSGGSGASVPTAESTPPPSAAPAVGGFGLLSLFSMVALALLF